MGLLSFKDSSVSGARPSRNSAKVPSSAERVFSQTTSLKGAPLVRIALEIPAVRRDGQSSLMLVKRGMSEIQSERGAEAR